MSSMVDIKKQFELSNFRLMNTLGKSIIKKIKEIDPDIAVGAFPRIHEEEVKIRDNLIFKRTYPDEKTLETNKRRIDEFMKSIKSPSSLIQLVRDANL